MIGCLRGKLIDRQPTRVLIDVQGVGYEVAIPLSTYDRLQTHGEEISLLTYLHVREDALQLYGFATGAEKELFLKLIGISGIGPRVALGVLSGCSVEAFYHFVRNGDINRLKSLPGIGRKTAERLVLELKDKVEAGESVMLPETSPASGPEKEEAVLALTSLGYSRNQAEQVIDKLSADGQPRDVETLIRLALQQL